MNEDRLSPLGFRCSDCSFIQSRTGFKCRKCKSIGSLEGLADGYLKGINDNNVYRSNIRIDTNDAELTVSEKYLSEINYNLIQVGRRLDDLSEKLKPIRLVSNMLIYGIIGSVIVTLALLAFN